MLRFWPLAFALAALPSLGSQYEHAAKSAGSMALLRTEGATSSFGSQADDEVVPGFFGTNASSSKGVEHVAPRRTDSIAVLPDGHALVMHAPKAHQSYDSASRHNTSLMKAVAPNVSREAVKTSKPLEMGPAKSPSHLYFGIGMGMFLLVLLAMAVGMKRMNYLDDTDVLTEGEASSSAANPQGEEDETPSRRPSSTNPVHPGDRVPFRMQQVLISWVFIVASVAYFLDFLSLQAGLESVRHWFGAVASLLWVIGFLVHLHWQVSVGSSYVQMVSSFWKVLACVMGQVHPFSMIMGLKETDAGVWWPAVTGIACWHIGNIIGSIDYCRHPPSGTNPRLGWLAHGNLPLTEMWVDQSATWMLLYESGAVTMWLGRPEKQLVATQNLSIVICQFGGATMFLLASCIRCEWCNGFQNCSHATPARDVAPAAALLQQVQ